MRTRKMQKIDGEKTMTTMNKKAQEVIWGILITIGVIVFLVVLLFVGLIYKFYPTTNTAITNGTKATDGTITCNTGYILNTAKDGCISTTTTTDTTITNGTKASDGKITCNSGYKVNTANDGCISSTTTTPGTITNGTKATDGTITCNTGYKVNTAKDGCISSTTTTSDTPITNGIKASDGTITCNTGYTLNTAKDGCITVELACYNQDTKNYSYIYDNNICKTCRTFLNIPTTFTDAIYNNITFTNTNKCIINSCPTTHTVDSTKSKCIINCKDGEQPSTDGSICSSCGNNSNVDTWVKNT